MENLQIKSSNFQLPNVVGRLAKEHIFYNR